MSPPVHDCVQVVACPACKAEPGELCMGAYRRVKITHWQRRNAYQEHRRTSREPLRLPGEDVRLAELLCQVAATSPEVAAELRGFVEKLRNDLEFATDRLRSVRSSMRAMVERLDAVLGEQVRP